MNSHAQRTSDDFSRAEGYRIAHQGITAVILRARAYITRERLQLDELNRPEIELLEAKRDFFQSTRTELLRRLATLPADERGAGSPSGHLTIAMALTGAAFGLAEVTIQPFNWGWAGHMFCFGLAISVPYATHLFVKWFAWRGVLRGFVVVSFVCAVGALVPLAEIRASQFARSVHITDAVVFDHRAESAPVQDDDSKRDADNLWWTMIFAAIGLEVASGLAWHEFRQIKAAGNSGLRKRLSKDLRQTEDELLEVLVKLRERLAEPARRYAAFWQGFHEGLNDAISKHNP